MTKTLKVLTATFAAMLVALAIGGGRANAGGVRFDFSVGVPVPFGYAVIHTDPWPYYPRYYGPGYYGPYYYAPYSYYRPYYRPAFREVYRPYYRHYRYERHIHRDWRHDRWRGHDGGRWHRR